MVENRVIFVEGGDAGAGGGVGAEVHEPKDYSGFGGGGDERHCGGGDGLFLAGEYWHTEYCSYAVLDPGSFYVKLCI